MSEDLGEAPALPDNSFHAPWRHRLPNGLPCWRSHPGYVLPQVSCVPGEGAAGGWWLMFMVGESHVRRHIRDGELLPFMEEWRADPEQALLVWFDRLAPQASAKPKHTSSYLDPGAVSNVSELSAEELF